MSKLNFILFILFASSVFFLLGCDDNNTDVVSVISCDDGVKNGDETGIDCGGSCPETCPPENAIEGEIVNVLELISGNEYVLNGPLIIRDGGELIIQEGITIKAQKNKNAYIAVTQGGKLFVYGRENNPVTITSNADNPSPGDWGGIVLFGKAPINTATVDRSDLLDIFYGGNEADDSSGFIRYLRIEYAGMEHDQNVRFNGITMYGVGSFTTLNHVQVHNSMGNGFRIVGGSIKPEKILSTNNQESGMVLSDGWQGSGNSWYLRDNGKASLELLNNLSNESAQPITTGQLEAMSFIGPSPQGGIYYHGGGGVITMSNIYTSGLDLGIQVGGDAAMMKIDNGDLLVNPIEFDNTNPGFTTTNYSGAANFFVEAANPGAGNRNGIPTWAELWAIGF